MAPAPSRALDSIVIKGAREHNLKNVDLTLPRNRLIVITGLSGSGKSSLAFDTIYAEGQRRYVESLSSYARQFLGQMEKPDVDYIEGLSPAISIDQKSTSRNPRSTVGTVTEIYDYLRLLYRADRQAALLQVRTRSQRAIERADRRSDPGAARRHAHPAARAGDPRPQGRVRRSSSRRSRKEGFARVRVDGEIARTAREDRPRQEAQAHDRGGRRPAGDEARHSQAADRLGRDDAAALDRHRYRPRTKPPGSKAQQRADVQRSARVRRTAGSRSKSSRRGCSRSTRRSARVPTAAASA